ncbi:phosphocholine-specific phospholipase C [Leadbetterella sp. DM7]|uniref:phosphocholine-specific phospholipase C n=1 Tax=Leadbetterella sp. DM7 TaxID=3235085 RepID=UPI00349E9844
MDSRREFIKKAGLIAGGVLLPESVIRASSISPAEGSTVWDADHVVILMQENRSFDHSFGALRGVRGFNDPRAVTLPDNRKVWLQTNVKNETFVPFRLNIKDTKATWMRDLPHSWENQVRARNDGKYDQWLSEKQSGNKDYKDIPLTLGHFNREDIPFYYAFADAFTVCDQNFSSSLTGTTPNRLYLWSGTIRREKDFSHKANVKNEDIDYGRPARWKSFPERLEEHGIDWRIYQNEISLPVGFEGEEESWLSNFTDNPIEWFEKYQVRFHPEYLRYLQERIVTLPGEIEALKKKENPDKKDQDRLAALGQQYKTALEDLQKYTPENFDKLPEFQKNIHRKAFTTNRAHADYHSLSEAETDSGEKMAVPRGDVLYEFRKDVESGKLPPVSWLVAPQNFSDHPSAPWYGAWYVSEVLDILTQNPEVWKKTVFILCYDENDGYYDHVPPFVAPHPEKPETGKASAGIDLWAEQVNLEHEKQRPYDRVVDGPIGLGFRVPLVIASPWSRGGKVCSEVFDHTSILMFLEKFIAKRYKKDITEENITEWRRTVCGDLSSVFTPFQSGKFDEFVQKTEFMKSIRSARDKELPNNFKALTPDEIEQINTSPETSPWMPQQEKGIKKALPIPYELFADIRVTENGKPELNLAVGNTFKTGGAPFFANLRTEKGEFQSRHYTLKKGDRLSDAIERLEGLLDVRVHGPNGFYRSFRARETPVEVTVSYPKNRQGRPLGDIEFNFRNTSGKDLELLLTDPSYHNGITRVKLKKEAEKTISADLKKSHNWYDFKLTVNGYPDFEWHYAGHVETGKESFTDPKMGKVL